MKLSAINLKGLAVLAAVLAVSTGSAVAQQYAPYGYSSQPSQQTNVPQYTAMVPQPSGAKTPSYMESVPPGPMQRAPQPAAQSAPMQPGYRVASAQAAPQPQPEANPSYESYTAGCATGNCGVNYDTLNGGCSPYNCAGDVSYGCCNPCGPRCHWFGGVYGLLMDRVNCSNSPLAFVTTTPGVGYYPTDTEIVMTSADLDTNIQGGAEFRFGATCSACGGCGGYGGCGDCGCSCGPLAWEAAYWGLAEETETATITDVSGDGSRTYGMMDFRGLVYNGRPVNDYFDYGPPTTDNTTPQDIEIRQLTASNSFSAQNLELNLLRLPLMGGGCMSCGLNDSCGGGACSAGCGGCGGNFCGPRCQLTSMIGFRYMRFDEDLYYRSDFEWMTDGTFGYLGYNVEADNNLIGFQIGSNGLYYMGCSGRFALQCGTNAGIYANHIEVNQWMNFPIGGSTPIVNPTGEPFVSSSDTDEVAFLGELRLGASYQCSCNCRFYAGYRALGVTGVALTANQVPGAFTSLGQIGYINCNGSLFLHGLQSGFEFCY
ncbi:hypothetical protein [Bythopirellula polymerisocia]|uniref:Stigma-specific protein, Stig1 n=1 Tax=Bythopirellula polymerisocia TaxID=2528003 RepID=A0A5C6D069_9BACT|nr:hypothetical protein [Bythopirellula polymerisocia]TWU30098.1 hypothetical protein Pla144_08840 [Bythopirellula polymerisocia]